MLTTNDLKIKERSQKNVKLTMITTNKTQPKEFVLKGKGKPSPGIVITTGNMEEYKKIRNKEMVRETLDAKIRRKKFADVIKANAEKEKK